MSLTEAQQFFASYRAAFNRLDGDAVADLWHACSGIADTANDAGRLTWWPEDAPMRANHRALCELYRHKGYHHAEFDIVDHLPLGMHHSVSRLHWTLKRADGSVLQQFHTAYHLMRTASGPRVLLATAYEEDIQEMKRHAAQ